MVEAREYKLDDILPGEEFVIEAVDDKQEPVKQASFNVAIDGREPISATSDDAGLVKVSTQASTAEVKLSFS